VNLGGRQRVHIESCDSGVIQLVRQYAVRLELPTDQLWLTTDRKLYGRWLGRHIPVRYGGAYCFVPRDQTHRILINLERIDQAQTRANEIVVAEELVHMRDHLDGDRRRHSHHGYDRIAVRVAELTGATPDDIRSALLPVSRRPVRYFYECPACRRQIGRRRKGRWSCGTCSPTFDRRYILRLLPDEDGEQAGMR
jgi:predicted SprT family Zn-dependent metalloprotease